MGRHRPRKSFEGLIESSPIVSARLSPDGTTVTYVTSNVEAVTGYTPRVVTGSGFHWMDLVHADDRAAAGLAVAEITDGRTEQVERVRVVGRGRRRALARAVFRHDQDGSDDLLGFFMDGYEPTTVEDHPAVAGNLLQSVLDDTSAAVYIEDYLDGRFLVVNRQSKKTSASRDQLLAGPRFRRVVRRACRSLYRGRRGAALDAGEPIQVEEIAQHEDGPHTYLS